MITEKIIKEISKYKKESKWMLKKRLEAFEIYKNIPTSNYGGILKDLNLNELSYYTKPLKEIQNSWEKVPKEIKYTFENLGVLEAEKTYLGGSGAQFESEMIYHALKTNLQKKGVIFMSTDDALKKHPEFFKKYFGKIVPANDNKFAALNSCVWSGGTFLYVPKNTKVTLPLQAYFRMNEEKTGQFERTLIIADEGSSVHYIEGCTAPTCLNSSLHAAVVEIFVMKNAHVQYTTIQNWSRNIFNLVTKRAYVYENGEMQWLDCNIGSKTTMKYPAIFLKGKNAKGEIHSLAIADKTQNIDAGGKIILMAENTKGKITSKSISKNGGISTYRGLIKIAKGAKNSTVYSSCDALILDEKSISNTYPKISSDEKKVVIEHEAKISKISEEQLFYVTSRGIPQDEAISKIVNGFANPIIKKFPMEYAIELNRLMEQ
jgi:Fe-S cluster assembly protein SufB